MKITLFGKKRDRSGETVTCKSFEDVMTRITYDTKERLVLRLRDDYRFMVSGLMDEPEYAWRIPRICPVAEYAKLANGSVEMKCYNGISVLTVPNLNESELEQVKQQAALLPQTLCAFVGADGHSVIVWTVATLPDGKLPTDEHMAEAFCVQAYATSVKCYAPTLGFDINVEEPTLRQTCMMTVDEHPYVNAHPAAFVIEQPAVDVKMRMVAGGEMTSRLSRLKRGHEAAYTFGHIYNTILHKVLVENPEWNRSYESLPIVVKVAEACAKAGLPEEETVYRSFAFFHDVDENEMRGTVGNAYEKIDSKAKGLGGLTKHQRVAFRLREFLLRRYEIRYNDVLQMTEFRPKRSLQFVFKELDKRALNTIFHEATLEGIEPTQGEVSALIHSNMVKSYNPIDEYLENLPAWDGKDRLKDLASLVPNDNPNWQRLFSRWFLSMVAHWMNMDQSHANATAPILVGAQGYRKSTFCRMLLAPELQQYFTDSIDFRSDIEAERSLGRFLLVNIDEFDQLNERQFAFIKHLFQKPVTNIRRMFSETIGTQRRYASFIGTSNHEDVLRDVTGNRRYLCVKVTAPIHTDASINYRQLYAQAKEMVLGGERYWLDDEDEALLKEQNKEFEEETPLEQVLLSAFEIPDNDVVGEWLLATDIMRVLQKLPGFNKRQDGSLVKLSKVLVKLGIKRKHGNRGSMYYLNEN